MTPPLAASFVIASSVLSRGWSLSARQLEWVMAIGLESSIASSVVRSPQWETSTSMPVSFMAAMIEAPKSLMPPSTRSVLPLPMRFWLL